MKHYYLLNETMLEDNSFKIAKISYKPVREYTDVKAESIIIKPIYNIEETASGFVPDKEAVPYKDLWYINKRFFLHPIRKYMVYEITSSENEAKALIVLREENAVQSKALRIVDYIGEQSLFSKLGIFFENLIKSANYEYIDLYTYGFEEKYIVSAGFSERKEDDTNIIPNYFSPFTAENIDIYVRSPYENTVFMKGDGDQDRPN